MKKNNIIFENDMVIIKFISKTYGSFNILIDNDDIEKIKKYYWSVKINSNNKFYAYTKYKEKNKRKTLYLHRFISNCDSDSVIDHLNGNSLDNRKHNLLVCSQYQNMQNRKTGSNNKSGHRNIYFDKRRKRWDVNIKKKRVGIFKTIEEALSFRNKYIWENMPHLFSLAYDRQ